MSDSTVNRSADGANPSPNPSPIPSPNPSPSGSPSRSPDGWDDDRLAAAFRTRFGAPAPIDLGPTVLAAVAETDRPRFAWLGGLLPGRRLAAAFGLVVAVGGLGLVGLGGLAGVGPLAGLRPPDAGLAFTIEPGPPGYRTFVTSQYAFDFPEDWLVYDSAAAFSGGSSVAVLTDLPVEGRCGSGHVDLNCVYEQKLEPGTFRLFVGGGGFRGDTIFSRADLDGFTTTRLTLAGMPAIRDERASPPGSYYLSDVELNWSIALPTSLTNVVRLESIVRQPSAATDQLEAVAASFRFTPPPLPFPTEPTAAEAAARRALATLADGLRRAYLGSLDTTANTYYDCFGPQPGEAGTTTIRVGPGGDLGAAIRVTCDWGVHRRADSVGEVSLTVIWYATDGTAGRYFETLWIDAAGGLLGQESAGDPPPPGQTDPGETPATGPSQTPDPNATPRPAIDFSVEVEDNVGPPTWIEIIDRSGHVVGARRWDGTASYRHDGAPVVERVDGNPRSVVLALMGAPCDGVITVTIQADGLTMTVDHGVLPACEASLVGRAIELTFDRDVDPAAVSIGRRLFFRTDDAWFFDLPVLTVGEALAVRDRPDDAAEIAVGGWYAPTAPISCPYQLPGLVPHLQPTCPHQFQWLMESPERLVTSTATGMSGRAPVGPALNPILPGGDRPWIPEGASIGQAGPPLVIVVGHFDDRDAVRCGPAEEAACRDQFVVDAVLWADGTVLGRTYDPRVERLADGSRIEPGYGANGVAALLGVSGVVPSETHVIAASPILGERLGELEPSLANGAHTLTRKPVVWVVRTLMPATEGPPTLRSFVVVDGTSEVWEAVADDWRQVFGGSNGSSG